MKEDFLHYIWKYKKFNTLNLKTNTEETVEVLSVGDHNHNSGPDFFNAKVRIADQLWAGNVEIHLRSSDWYSHKHQKDTSYDNVILHVVWEHDAEVFRKNNERIPVLELREVIDKGTLDNYHMLFANMQRWIPCENDLSVVDDFVWDHWLERLYIERLEQKSQPILQLLESSNNDWEAVLFKMMAKSFGLKVNGEAFFAMSRSFDFSLLRRLQQDLSQLEALLLGQAGLLENSVEDAYFQRLKKDYEYLVRKFHLANATVPVPQFFRLRPNNFPTIRLAQLANLYHTKKGIFSTLMRLESRKEFYDELRTGVSEYWERHYGFGIQSKKRARSLSKDFIDLLLLNTIIPIKFCYMQQQGKSDVDGILKLAQDIKPEDNAIVRKFNSLTKVTESAVETQALLQLKSFYCEKHQCLRCAIGNELLGRN
ncbi:DUF2851 family protein [Sungkyunkwania multivorans]|uniref:DUF2851 family protein n=1 Tax=Sungkyunkwania multivorans TaxID=1173618 RepID=A0ABW3CYH3_9FLAO